MTRLWFRQSLRNTLWLASHPRGYYRPRFVVWWRLLLGRCVYCGRKDCVD